MTTKKTTKTTKEIKTTKETQDKETSKKKITKKSAETKTKTPAVKKTLTKKSTDVKPKTTKTSATKTASAKKPRAKKTVKETEENLETSVTSAQKLEEVLVEKTVEPEQKIEAPKPVEAQPAVAVQNVALKPSEPEPAAIVAKPAVVPTTTPEPKVQVVPVPEKPKPVEKPAAPSKIEAPKPKIAVNENTTVKDLAEKMSVKVGDILMKLLKLGVRASLNQRLDSDSATLIAGDFGFDAEFVPLYSEEAMTHTSEKDNPADLVPRAPIVTIMGHVDHGKTSLLDSIRLSKVVEQEAGGITQHIGAYKISTDHGSVVFLDTPGHEAFTAMRARGAQATDIVILVVAANDGVMPQTVEAIDHAKAAGVPIIVAVNKIDLPDAKADRVKQELSNYDLTPEEWGGKTIFVEISAKKKINIDKLIEMLLLEAELLELKANPKRLAQGVVIESKLDPKRGVVTTVLVQKGTLKVGQAFVCGLSFGRVKAIADEHGHRHHDAGPSTPVEILGFSEAAQLGDRLIGLESEREAKGIIEHRKNLHREATFEKKRHISLEMLSTVAKEGKVQVLNIILKADVQGSVEALKDSLEKLHSNEIRLRVIHSGVGGITESDVSLAAASDAVVIGFNVRPEIAGEELARKEGVEIKTYRVIYEVVNTIRAAMEGMLQPEEKETTIGRIEVREVFKTPLGKVAGCMVVRGKAVRTAQIRLLRDNKIIHESTFSSLRRFKDDVKEVEQGYECGASIENYNDFNVGDSIEIYIREKQARKLGD